jgi:hypothetical protein
MTSNIKVRIEQLSFESCGEYMDIQVRDGYVDITIGGAETAQFAVDLADWKIITQKVFELLEQEQKLEKNKKRKTENKNNERTTINR